MPAAVVDTDVVSYLFKKDTRARLFRPHLLGKVWIISFMTQAELDLWALRANWGQKILERMDRHLAKFVLQPFERNLCQLWAEVTDRARRKGFPIDVADAWVAATALSLGIPLVTHNPKDYAGVDGLVILTEVFNP